MAPKVPFIMKYLKPMPKTRSACNRRDFPEPGDFSYILVPIDVENNVAIERSADELKSAVFNPHPDNPNATIVLADTANLALFPAGASR